ncbi:MAG TPA: hypothetical protein VJ276_20280 [Thermoanaerobaculia bacterium]|nr:hypothetical protein [Thermoanaerobaculia bacterium]
MSSLVAPPTIVSSVTTIAPPMVMMIIVAAAATQQGVPGAVGAFPPTIVAPNVPPIVVSGAQGVPPQYAPTIVAPLAVLFAAASTGAQQAAPLHPIIYVPLLFGR